MSRATAEGRREYRNYYFTTPGRRERKREYDREYYQRTRRQAIAKARQKKTGFTAEHFDAQFSLQRGRCAICFCDLTKLMSRHVHADHCHATKQRRGVLCGHCNTGMGNLFDDPARLQSAINYLNVWRSRIVC